MKYLRKKILAIQLKPSFLSLRNCTLQVIFKFIDNYYVSSAALYNGIEMFEYLVPIIRHYITN